MAKRLCTSGEVPAHVTAHRRTSLDVTVVSTTGVKGKAFDIPVFDCATSRLLKSHSRTPSSPAIAKYPPLDEDGLGPYRRPGWWWWWRRNPLAYEGTYSKVVVAVGSNQAIVCAEGNIDVLLCEVASQARPTLGAGEPESTTTSSTSWPWSTRAAR